MTTSTFPFDTPNEPFTLAEDQRWSRYGEPGILTGPEPAPQWLITDDGAIETELGTLKSGKEADVDLLERTAGARTHLLAAKRYRSREHRDFHRDSVYTDGRRERRSRDQRAVTRGTRYGRAVQAGQWAGTEFSVLCDLAAAGAPVPYPVQLDGTEILMELVTDVTGDPAPRLAATRPDPELLAHYWDELRRAMRILASRQLAHGDLSPYNVLATGERLVVIDVPQVVDLVANPHGIEMLSRDCRTMCSWFTARGLGQDPDVLLAEMISFAW
ncbi:serine protein kinase RIO [Ruania halotolerans]|uniref:serine protein kinase RIO n=1 Tax=Ruania halotolerans TaxID=2897773 RepID=UPI001E2E3610|nr:RIO1 family regulatory kinase/ATPase [Ruania halotolerans]UFU08146.1 serine/threonine protein kinase [Ruania halotolerans]